MHKTILLLSAALTLPLFARGERKVPYKEKIDSMIIGEMSKATYTYDEHGNHTLKTIFYKMNDEWVENSQYHFAYDSKKRIIGEWSMSLTLGEWVGQNFKEVYTYDSQDRVESETSYDWDSTSSSWILYDKKEFTYTNFDSVQTEFFYRIDDETEEWDLVYKTEYTYDHNNKLTLKLTQEPYLSGWEEYSKYEYKNDANGNKLEAISYHWFGNDWLPLDKHSYTFNGSNQRITYIKSEYNDTEWIEKDKEDRTYHPSGERATNIIYKKSGDQWIPSSKREDNFDDHRNKNSVILYTYSDDWTPLYKYDSHFDLNTPASEVLFPEFESFTHKCTGETISRWVKDENRWEESQKNTFHYSPLITPVIKSGATISETDIDINMGSNLLKLSVGNNKKATVMLFTLHGRLLGSEQFIGVHAMDLRNIATGVYITRIKTADGIKDFRISK